MKKILTLLCTSLIVLLMFVGPVSPAKASETDSPEVQEPCICDDVTVLTGVERNKAIANLIKTDAFKDVRKDLKLEGLKWNGVNEIQVMKHNQFPLTIVGVPFTSGDGTLMMAVFFNGILQGVSDPSEDSHSH
jgi:hypothetical protein